MSRRLPPPTPAPVPQIVPADDIPLRLQFLSPKRLAEAFDVSPRTVYRWIGEGLPAQRIQGGRRLLIPIAGANNWMRQHLLDVALGRHHRARRYYASILK